MTAFGFNERAYRQKSHDEYTGGNMTRQTTANPIISAGRSGPCPDPACVMGGTITIGQKIRPNVDRKWAHVEDSDPKTEALREPIRVAHFDALSTADAADKLMDEYDATRLAQARARRVLSIPVGTFTVRPADERSHIVLSVGKADFGNFAPGTVKVSMHGSFSILVDGLSQSRSWFGFALVRPDGSVSMYKNARAITETLDGNLRPEDVHVKAKLRLAMKALRLLVAMTEDEIMEAGRAWAMTEQACFVCSRPLTDEESQKSGIGPVCRRKLREQIGA